MMEGGMLFACSCTHEALMMMLVSSAGSGGKDRPEEPLRFAVGLRGTDLRGSLGLSFALEWQERAPRGCR
jgi:hypothetical protein